MRKYVFISNVQFARTHYKPEVIECDVMLVDMAFNTAYCFEVITDISVFDMMVISFYVWA